MVLCDGDYRDYNRISDKFINGCFVAKVLLDKVTKEVLIKRSKNMEAGRITL